MAFGNCTAGNAPDGLVLEVPETCVRHNELTASSLCGDGACVRCNGAPEYCTHRNGCRDQGLGTPGGLTPASRC